jgi:hypothetical protein
MTKLNLGNGVSWDVEDVGDDHVRVHTRCGIHPNCGEPAVPIVMPTKGFLAYFIEGAMIQDALPDLSASDRERLMGRVCPKMWRRLEGN